jgi:hypothetical protein
MKGNNKRQNHLSFSTARSPLFALSLVFIVFFLVCIAAIAVQLPSSAAAAAAASNSRGGGLRSNNNQMKSSSLEAAAASTAAASTAAASTPVALATDVPIISITPIDIAVTYFTCDDGIQQINSLWVNDDYCDCTDGSDEHSTSACSVQLMHIATFDCGIEEEGSSVIDHASETAASVQHAPARRQQRSYNHRLVSASDERSAANEAAKASKRYIYMSKVNDGVVDCKDGSDER